jgi:hypothetical protein
VTKILKKRPASLNPLKSVHPWQKKKPATDYADYKEKEIR